MSGVYSRVRQLITGLSVGTEQGLYQVVFDTAAAGMVTTSASGIVESCNPAFCRIFGYEPEDLHGQNISMLMMPHHSGKHDGYIQRYLAGHSASVMGKGREVIARHRNGEAFMVHLTVSEMTVGGETGFVAIVHDLSNRTVADSYPMDRTWLGLVLDKTPAGLTVKDVNGRYLLLNERAEKMLNVSAAEAVGHRDADLFSPIWSTMHRHTDEECRASGTKIAVFPFSSSADDQQPKRYLCSKSVLSGSGDEPMGIVTIMIDVTNVSTGHHLSELNHQLLDTVAHPVALLLATGEFVYANTHYAARFGLNKASLTGSYVQLVEDETISTKIRDALSATPCVPDTFTADGTQFRVDPVPHNSGYLYVLSIVPEHYKNTQITDISVATPLQMISHISHEIRTPLSSILGFSQLLRKELHNKEQIEAVELIEKAGDYLMNLVTQVLEYAKANRSELNVKAEALNVAIMIHEVIGLMQLQACDRGIMLESVIAVDEPWVMADHTMLKQILLNLVSNAIKYNTNNGRVTVRLQSCVDLDVITDGCDNSRLVLSVEDTGIGIPEHKMQHMFEPFNRLGAETSGVTGTGLGLSICQSLAHRMKFHFHVSSIPGKGSVFRLIMPSAASLYSMHSINMSALNRVPE